MSFQYVEPTSEQKAVMQIFREQFTLLAQGIASQGPSRGVSLALTKLEESAFWLNKAITKND